MFTNSGNDEHGETQLLESEPLTDSERQSAAKKVSELLTLAEAATVCGREAHAAYLISHAEHVALETGLFSLIHQVWKHSLLRHLPEPV